MYNYNIDGNKWTRRNDTLTKYSFDAFKQDFESIKMFSKCLSGATYVDIDSFDDIYENLKYKNEDSYYISSNYSEYSANEILDKEVTPSFYVEDFKNYGNTIKNYFSPNDLLKTFKNIIDVQYATILYDDYDESNYDLFILERQLNNNIDLSQSYGVAYIDGKKLTSGDKVLFRTQVTFEYLPLDVNISEYLGSEKYSYIQQTIDVDGIPTTMNYVRYDNGENGIYEYDGIKFNRLDIELDKLYVYVENGELNGDKLYSIDSKLNGYATMTNDKVHHYSKVDKYSLRHKVDYNNAFDINFKDILQHTTHNINIDGNSHTIPERIIAVGEFGNIILNQNNTSISINNRNKSMINSITSTNGYYWVCGDGSSIIKINKVTLEPEYIEIDDFRNFNSIDFIDDMRGVVVGDMNVVYVTIDGGRTWTNISTFEHIHMNFTKVKYASLSDIYISGNNGIFLHTNYENNKWIFTDKYISKVINDELSVVLECNITDFYYDSDRIWIISEEDDIIEYNILDDKFKYYDIGFTFNELQTITKYNNDVILLGDNDKVYEVDLSNYTTLLEGTNILSGATYIPSIKYEGYITNMIYNDVIYIVGNNSLFGYIDNDVYVPMDSNFNSKISSKMLFLDYDIASKLNFFTDDGVYRLPNKVFIPTNITTDVEFSNSDNSWIDFYSDSLGVFEYLGGSTNSKIELNKRFTKVTDEVIITSPNISIDKTYAINYFPTINDNTQNIYLGSDSSINAQSDSIQLVLVNNLMVIKANISTNYSIGDVIEIKSSVVETNVIINKIIQSGGYNLIYTYTGFNDNINRGLKDNQSTISIKNLNKFTNSESLVENFNNHIFGLSYNMEIIDNEIMISGLFSNISSYYNLDIDINVNGSDYLMRYEDSYLKFGYETKYNIGDYLKNISSVFTDDMEFAILPKYENIPVGNLENSSNNIIKVSDISNNKISFAEGLYSEYVSILNNTFVDLYYDGVLTDERILIVDKGYNALRNEYEITFNRKLSYTSVPDTMNIVSRNTLRQISSDLELLNNIYKPKFNKTINGGHTYDTFEKQLESRFYTDSYARALLSNSLIKDHITSIIYIDNNHSLCMNLINVEDNREVGVSITSDGLQYKISFAEPHDMNIEDYIIVDIDNKNEVHVSGLHIIDSIVDEYTVISKSTYYDVPGVSERKGTAKIIERDIFFSYLPVDISKVNNDRTLDIPIELYITNYRLDDSIFKLINVDMKNYRYTLVDNMLNSEIHDKYHWILEAEVSKAIIGKDDDGLVWYRGEWKCGRWFGGKWNSGTWISGDFYRGTWNSLKNEYRLSYLNESDINIDEYSFWYGGRWYDGTWNGGVWYGGRWYGGSFNNGTFCNGIWNGGTFNNGAFSGGVWVDGIFNNGIFNCDIYNSYWINGIWNGGDFENGRWMNGIFNKLPNGISRFGTKSTSSKQSIWDTGTFNGGEVHSYITMINDKLVASDVYRNTIFKNCEWNNGSFYGGIAYNINFKGGDFYGGIVDDIQVKSIHVRNAIYSNVQDAIELKVVLNGIFHFKDNNTLYLFNNMYNSDPHESNEYEIGLLGNYDNIKSYRVLESEIVGDSTELILRSDLYTYDFDNITGSSTVEPGYFKSFYDSRVYPILGDKEIPTTLVSRFKNSTVHNCTWYNGIFEDGHFIGGTWYNGYFNGNWGK